MSTRVNTSITKTSSISTDGSGRAAGTPPTMKSANHQNQLPFLIPPLTILILGSYLTGTTVTVITLLTYTAFVLPGFIFLKNNKLSNVTSIIYGAPIGISITSVIVIVFVAVNGWNILHLSAIYLVLILITWLAAYLFAIRSKCMSLTFGKIARQPTNIPSSIYLIISFYIIVTFFPLNEVGKITDYGYAFTGLFSHDFILRALDSVALAKDIPADNYFFLGQKTHNYYVLWYVLPATVYNLVGTKANIRDIISLICLVNIPLFFSFLFFTLSDFVHNSNNAHATPISSNRKLLYVFLIPLFCYSYHWMYVLLKALLPLIGIHGLDSLFSHMHSLSQSWFRDIIFEPHCVLSLMMILLIIKIVTFQPSFLRGLAIGWILASIALTDMAMFFIASSAHLIYLISQIRSKRDAIVFKDLFGTLLCGSGILAIMLVIGIFVVPEYSNDIVIRPYWMVILGLPLFLILHYAVMPVAAIPAIKQMGNDKKGFIVTVTLVSLFFMLFVTETLEGNVILRKSMKVLRLPFILFTCYYVYHTNKNLLHRIAIICFLAALPTFMTDLHVLMDVTNKSCTTYVTEAEMEGALWLKSNTPRDAVVQSLIDYPGYFDYSVTIYFGERRAALGLWKMAFQRYPNNDAIRKRAGQIKMMFSTGDNTPRYDLARKLKLKYVFIGNKEEERFPGCGKRFRSDAKHFKRVFANREVAIYEVIFDV